MSYLYELPTTGAISFAEILNDPSGSYTIHISDATHARANLRATLKESKRTDGEKDYLRLVKVLDDYIPHLCAIIASIEQGELSLKITPIFSWRTTLSSNLLSNSPRISLPTLQADLAYSLLTYAFALSNLARASVLALGAYEHERTLSDAERTTRDGKLSFGATLLCKASGVFTHVADVVVPAWEEAVKAAAPTAPFQRPQDLSREVTTALAKMALADAQAFAIRKLLTKASAEAALRPGAPLPSSHPAPGLLGKLHLESSALLSGARALAGTDVSACLRRYLNDEGTLHDALARKWLGVDAGESRSGARVGHAVGWLTWSKRELEEIKSGGDKGGSVVRGDREKEMRERRKAVVAVELESVGLFLRHYTKLNDSLSFQPVPPQAEIQALIPAGRLAVASRPYSRSIPPFGPGSTEFQQRQEQELERGHEEDVGDGKVEPNVAPRKYAGADAYF